jgi:hypothetical protein
MFNPNKHVLQIGAEDYGGGCHVYRAPPPPPKRLVQLQHNEATNQWVVDGRTIAYLWFDKETPEPYVKDGEVTTIKILDYVIECKRVQSRCYTMQKISAVNGAVFNTLQLQHHDPLVQMLKATVYVPVTDLFK